ncbi:hypothetical protein [Pseudoalteromonas tetraodonis]|uniref:hypothetical protein n=1 Tax=Pseudoalteromonas tetraodonis TaxID=43659 RepID=UPI003A97CF40
MSLKEKLSKFVNGWVQATKEQFTGHPVANLFRQDLKDEIEQLGRVDLCGMKNKQHEDKV